MARAIKTVAVLGAGHGGHAAAADLGSRGFHVRLHARNADRLQPIRAAGGVIARGVVDGTIPVPVLTTDVREACDGADLIMLVVPSVAHEYYAHALAPILTPDRPVFVNPGHTGGGLHFVHELRQAGYRQPVKTCETVTLTYITRMEGPATVGIYSYTKKLGFAAFPGRHAEELFGLLKPLYPEIELRSSVLETALTNLNAVFHPPGMLMNTGWIEATNGNFLFYYEGMTEGPGRVTKSLDDERIAIAKKLGIPVITFLEMFYKAGLTTKEAFESGNIARACRESAPNRTLRSPSSLDHRYVHEDVGYGLVPMAALGRVAGVPTPTIDAIVHLMSVATGIDYARTGLTLDKLDLAGKTPEQVQRFLFSGE